MGLGLFSPQVKRVSIIQFIMSWIALVLLNVEKKKLVGVPVGFIWVIKGTCNEPSFKYVPTFNLCYVLHYVQRDDTNSPESVTKTVLPINLFAKQPLQSAENDTVCEVSFRNDLQHNGARGEGLLRRFTECSEPKEDQNKDELLELFPLNPDGNLRSQTSPQYCEGSFTEPRGSNVMIGSEAKKDGNRHELLLFPLHPEENHDWLSNSYNTRIKFWTLFGAKLVKGSFFVAC